MDKKMNKNKSNRVEKLENAGKSSREGRVDHAGEASRRGRADHARKPSGEGRTGNAGKSSREERGDYAGKQSRRGRTDYAGKLSREGRADHAEKPRHEGIAGNAGEMSREKRVDYAGKPSREGRMGYAGKSSREERVDYTGKPSRGGKVGNVGKANREVRTDYEEKSSRGGSAGNAGKPRRETKAGYAGKPGREGRLDYTGKPSHKGRAGNAGKSSSEGRVDHAGNLNSEGKAGNARKPKHAESTDNAGKLRHQEKRENLLGDCIYTRACGACQYQGIEYKQQLKQKQKQTEALLGDIVKVEPILGMEHPFHYRNKVNAAFGRLRNGTIISGVYKEGTHEIIDIAECQIEDVRADAIIQDIKGLLHSFKIKTYDEDTEYGLLRHVMVRVGHTSGEVMVVLVLASPILPSKNNFVKAIRKQHPEITTVVLNVNEKRTSMVLGQRNITLYGKGFIEDTLCGLTFRISPSSFYQINSAQTEVLYGKAMEYAGLTGNERVLDAYCGIGTIGMVAAKQASEVIGVESNSSAIRDAITNAKRNELKHITFYNRDASEFIVELADRGEKVDVIFMDPPRAGSTEEFIDAVATLEPKRVVYVSCNPETLARDLKYFVKKGYVAKRCQPVDMFPWTEHVECVVLMSRVEK